MDVVWIAAVLALFAALAGLAGYCASLRKPR